MVAEEKHPVAAIEGPVRLKTRTVQLEGHLTIPEGAGGIVLFAHGSGSGRWSPRNRFVAAQLNKAGLATLLVDLLSEEEEAVDRQTGEVRFDIGLLAGRLVDITRWLAEQASTANLPIGCFGASTGGGAALVAAARSPQRIAAVVSRGGRPDLAGESLRSVRAPTLLIVGGNDLPVIRMNREAMAELASPVKEVVIVAGATHLFEEPGKLEEVARLAADWFTRYLVAAGEVGEGRTNSR